jgi:hypothetical protein
MPRKKSEKIAANTREAKKSDWHLVGGHNNRSGVSAFKKRLRHQYGRRLTNRELALWAWERNNATPKSGLRINRPERVPVAPEWHYRRVWVLDDTMMIALREGGLI